MFRIKKTRFMRTDIMLRLLLLASACNSSKTPSLPTAASCRYLPGDSEWPSATTWNELNATVEGRLIASIPLASVCHSPEFSESACEDLRESWIYAKPHIQDPSSIYAPYWLNNSCTPFTETNVTCTLGNLVSYTINVSSAADVAAGISFARVNNLRLVIKNTGHDFLGRSTGKGALGLWMHHLKNISFFDYHSDEYKGDAVRTGAGVEVSELASAASVNGVRTVTGWCPSVGYAGGYTAGGGHGPLASAYGLAADNTLAFEVVTADGQLLTVSKTAHPDLYWALSGGGAGTYAVVLAQISKTYPDGPIGGLSLSLTHDNSDNFWVEVFGFWQSHLLELDALPGFSSGALVTNVSFGIGFITWPGHTGDEVTEAISPFITLLNQKNISFSMTATTEPSYDAHFWRHSPPDYPDFGVVGGRLITREAVKKNGSALIQTMRNIAFSGKISLVIGQMNVTHTAAKNTPADNAVLPAWRDALYTLSTPAFWDPSSPIEELHGLQVTVNEEAIAALRELTPGSGTYSNEGTFDLKTWKEDYYGINYDRLLSVKNKYDPDHILYGAASVGSDYWVLLADGRLCRTL